MSEIPSALLPNLPETEVAAPQAPVAPPSPYTVPLLQVDTHAIMPIEQDHADVAIRSGLYAPKNDAEFIVLDKYGNRNVVAGTHVRDALNNGMRLESTAERHERELQENYGGVSGMSQALGAAVARGGTLGLSDLAAAGSPEAQQHLSNLEEANPITSTVGEVAGFLGGSLLGSVEGSAAAKGASLAVRGVEKLGAGAGRVVEKAILRDATKAGLTPKIASSIASKMAQEATIGSVVGAGNLVSEAALGKADFNAENLAASVGMGAIIGGAFGASLGAAEAAMPLIKSATKPVTDLVSDFTSREKAALEILGYTPAKGAKLADKNPQMFKDLPDWLVKEVGLQPGDDAAAMLAKFEKVKKTSGTGIGDSISAYDKIISEAPELATNRKSVYFRLADELDEKFLQSASGSPESKAKLAQAGKYYDELVKAGRESEGSMTLKELQEARKNAYDLGYGANGAPIDTLEGQMARFAGRYYSDALKAAAEKVSKQIGDEQLFANFIQNHKNYTYASEALPKLKLKAFKGESINPIVASVLGAGAGSIIGEDGKSAGLGALAALGARSFIRSDMRRNLVVLGKIEKAQQKVAQMVDRAAGSLVSGPAKSSVRALPISIIDSEFAKRYENGKYKKPSSVNEAFQNLNENFERYAQNPEAFTSRVNRSTSAIYKQAPETSAALDAVAVSAAMFLATKVPKRHSQPGMLDVFKKKRPTSSLDLAVFEKYLTAVEHPERVFKDMEHGRLSKESVEALKTVYPNLYSMLQDKTLEHVGANPNMPYSRKLQLGLLLDVPTDESLLAENIVGLQNTFSKPEESQGAAGAVKPTQAGLSELGAGERLATETQADTELS